MDYSYPLRCLSRLGRIVKKSQQVLRIFILYCVILTRLNCHLLMCYSYDFIDSCHSMDVHALIRRNVTADASYIAIRPHTYSTNFIIIALLYTVLPRQQLDLYTISQQHQFCHHSEYITNVAFLYAILTLHTILLIATATMLCCFFRFGSVMNDVHALRYRTNLYAA